MVSLEMIRASNSHIATSLPAGLVAVFVGATSGIGETTLKQFAKQAQQPRIYFVGRRESEGKRIQAELKHLNPAGEYHFVETDASLLKNVDDVCHYLRVRESAINLLFLSCGSLIIRKQTDEGLHYPMALMYYARMRFIVNLLPQLKKAQSLRRVITANNIGILSFRPHATSMVTLKLLAIAKQAPNVSFIHDYPGFVNTGMSRELTGIVPAITKVLFAPVMAIIKIPIDETGERQLYFATSARFPPRNHGTATAESGDMIALGQVVSTAVGADGTPGGGVYSIDYEAEGTSERVQRVLEGLKKDGTAEKVWKHIEDEFVRITGSTAI
ncbi:hypothetical protein VMCG_08366 [Cytospora schulzeri]|uniref:Ketoreductase (KR) domain-containing protein n=1 Tax=Cytospora schulzeri TaxID=448051 RepID=A0A423VVE6_9PEZI|nr:hypothetical protein VMCG_08366 [Valsa malicola]